MKFNKKKSRSRGPSLDLGEDMDYDLALVDNDAMDAMNADAANTDATSPAHESYASQDSGIHSGIQHVYDDSVAGESKKKSGNIDCLYSTCFTFYFIALTFTITVTSLLLVFWPQIPVYNVCSDELNWSSIVDGMTSFETSATFQLLASVYNPNHFDAVIVSGTGIMHHNGINVGVINLGDEVKISGTAITDIMFTATFSSEKWEAASLSAEYAKGTLSFIVDADVTVKIPALFGGFTYTADWKNFQIDVGDFGDRSLCACEDWDAPS
jgi:hypothetical protein